MEVKHCCADCGEVIAVHEHSSWQQIKDCQAGMRAPIDFDVHRAGRSNNENHYSSNPARNSEPHLGSHLRCMGPPIPYGGRHRNGRSPPLPQARLATNTKKHLMFDLALLVLLALMIIYLDPPLNPLSAA
jgi:hypothetical protein